MSVRGVVPTTGSPYASGPAGVYCQASTLDGTCGDDAIVTWGSDQLPLCVTHLSQALAVYAQDHVGPEVAS